ncbi:hypothetical protein, conserved [Angomonas deanei]|uniref:Uncharacterized protein n=1 Tax=Angomonas deanei TaxID=59799 RepID=A0A7G2BZB4_9TRYP|nr:hypothetical protein, conserved [Angomonas deanei]
METFFKLTDNSAEETEKEATQNSKKTETLRKHIRENSVSVLLLLEKESVFFSVLFHVYNPVSYDKKAQDAAEHFCFTNEPLLVPHPQTMVAVEKPTAHKVKKRAQQMIHVTNTVLLYREEYFRGSGAEPLQSDDNNNKDEETTPIEESEIQRRITHKSSNPNFFKEKENFQQQYLRNCELLLTSELVSSKAMDDKKKKSTQIRKNEASFKKVKQFYKKNNIVTISKFAPKKYLLKKYNWTSRPVQLAEEMRYGLIVFFSK